MTRLLLACMLLTTYLLLAQPVPECTPESTGPRCTLTISREISVTTYQSLDEYRKRFVEEVPSAADPEVLEPRYQYLDVAAMLDAELDRIIREAVTQFSQDPNIRSDIDALKAAQRQLKERIDQTVRPANPNPVPPGR